jgi:hypothetical protein
MGAPFFEPESGVEVTYHGKARRVTRPGFELAVVFAVDWGIVARGSRVTSRRIGA